MQYITLFIFIYTIIRTKYVMYNSVSILITKSKQTLFTKHVLNRDYVPLDANGV